MMRSRIVLELVLNELEPGQTDGIIGEVIRASSVLQGERRRSHICGRGKPLPENRPDGFVPLHVDAADLTAAVVVVKVDGKFLGFRLQGSFTWFSPRTLMFSEVVRDVGCRSEE